MLEFIVEEFLW